MYMMYMNIFVYAVYENMNIFVHDVYEHMYRCLAALSMLLYLASGRLAYAPIF